MTATTATTTERDDLVAMLEQHRQLLLRTTQGMDEAQLRATPTVSELCLGGIVKHVTAMEEGWVRFIESGPAYEGAPDESVYAAHVASFQMTDQESGPGLLERYRQVADRTDELVRSLPSLDATQPLPAAPWFEPGARWTARRSLVHIVAETAQHAGHADIIRETIDGAKSMG